MTSAGRRSPDDHRHLIHLDERRMLCACETCWSVRSGDPYSARRGPDRMARRLRPPDEVWASFGIPIGLAFFMRTGEPAASSPSTPARPGRPSRRSTSAPGTAAAREPGAGAARARLRGADRQPDVRAPPARDRADRRVLPAGRPDQVELGGDLGRHRAGAGDRRFFAELRGGRQRGRRHRAPGPGASPPRSPQATAPGRTPDLEFEILAAAAARARRGPDAAASRPGSATGPGARCYTVALTMLITIEPGKRSLRRAASASAWSSCSGSPSAGRRRHAAFRWAQVDVLVPSFSGETDFEIPSPAPTTTRSPRRSTSTGSPTGRAAALPLQRHGLLRGDGGRLQLMLVPWDRSSRFELPIETWRADDRRHYPGGAWVRLSDETLERLRG